MATTEELLAAAEEDSDTEYLVVDWETRAIEIPSNVTILGVESDDNTTRLSFKCPAVYGEFDISTFDLRINYENYNGSNVLQSSDCYYVDDAVSDGETITFSWLVGRNAYTSKGKTNFIVCGKLVNSDGDVIREINTTLASLTVLEGLETTEAIVASNADIIGQIMAQILKLSGSTSSSGSGSTSTSGVGISSLKQTTTSTASGGANVWTATLTDGTTSKFTVYNGAQGEQGTQGEKGDTGASAYEVAVANGYEGTEAEWLESLKGESGGATGASDAYEIAYGNTTIGDILDDLTYTAPTVTAKSSPTNGGTYEIGTSKSVTAVTVTITLGSADITQIEVFNSSGISLAILTDGIVSGTNTITLNSAQTVSDTEQFYAVVTDSAGKTTTAYTTKFNFVYAYYYGGVAEGTDLTEDVITGLTKSITSKGTKTFSYTLDNQCAVIAYPASYGAIAKVLDANSFDITDTFTQYSVTIDSVAYYAYMNNASTVTSFNMTFSY